MEITANDYDRLSNATMGWAKSFVGGKTCACCWKSQVAEGRFENSDDDAPINLTFKYVYWVGEHYTTVILMKHFLKQRGFKFQVLWDTVDTEQYCVITDYAKE